MAVETTTNTPDVDKQKELKKLQRFIKSENATNQVVVWSNSDCSQCEETKTLFQSIEDIDGVVVHELDQMDNGDDLQEQLAALTGQSTFPNVFIGNLHVGGNDEIQTLHKEGTLQTKLDDYIKKCKRLRKYVKAENASNQVVIWSKSFCPYCKKTKAVFESIEGIDVVVHELDKMEEGLEIQQELFKLTGQKSVPNVFVGNNHLGGNDDTQKAHEHGSLQTMLDDYIKKCKKLRKYVKAENASNQVVIWSKSFCPYCKKTKAIFESIEGIDVVVHELDKEENGLEIQQELFKLTGQKSVPNVFVGNNHLGGNDDTQKAHEDGSLQTMLDDYIKKCKKLRKYVKAENASNQVVIWSKSFCPYCKKTKAVFESIEGIDVVIHELDKEENGLEIQQELFKLTGQKSVPNVFVGNNHLGGNDDTQKAHEDGTLQTQLDDYIKKCKRLRKFVKGENASSQVVIWSKSFCPYCKKTKALFESIEGANVLVHELDKMDEGLEIQQELFKLTGQKSVPNVFVNNQHLGGNDDTQKAHEDGTIQDLLNKHTQKVKDLQEFIKTENASNQVVVWSKSFCPYCKKTKELFGSMDNVKMVAHELDKHEHGLELQHELFKLTGQKSVPNVFINNKHVGGNDDVQRHNTEGTLQDLL